MTCSPSRSLAERAAPGKGGADTLARAEIARLARAIRVVMSNSWSEGRDGEGDRDCSPWCSSTFSRTPGSLPGSEMTRASSSALLENERLIYFGARQGAGFDMPSRTISLAFPAPPPGRRFEEPAWDLPRATSCQPTRWSASGRRARSIVGASSSSRFPKVIARHEPRDVADVHPSTPIACVHVRGGAMPDPSIASNRRTAALSSHTRPRRNPSTPPRPMTSLSPAPDPDRPEPLHGDGPPSPKPDLRANPASEAPTRSSSQSPRSVEPTTSRAARRSRIHQRRGVSALSRRASSGPHRSR